MARLQPIQPKACDWPPCHARATHRVVNAANESAGEFCLDHGRLTWERTQQAEEAKHQFGDEA